ncbi:hypothetical protein [Agrobacterium pusense]|uniref:hypothetical protein n=1 Tax=Agrobacterium pusense TaxID=648995 RepID=UPI001300A36F|nr:hypothetical protein [Agrobacterium pusense]
MKSILLPAGILVVLLGLGIWVGGVRVVVTAENSDVGLSSGTLVVANVPYLNLLDSPQAICARDGKPGNNFCAAGVLAGIGQDGKVLINMPFSQTLYRMTGAERY